MMSLPLKKKHSSLKPPHSPNLLLPEQPKMCLPIKGKKETAESSDEDGTTMELTAREAMDYLAELIKERKNVQCFEAYFPNVLNLLDREVIRVQEQIFCSDFEANLELPPPTGELVTMTEKVYVPTKEYPEVNFVGLLIGPRGHTARLLEERTGCKVMVRGHGSIKEKVKNSLSREIPNASYENDALHVLLQCEDTQERAKMKLENAVKIIKKLLDPEHKGFLALKKKQLTELAIYKGLYKTQRDKDTEHRQKSISSISLSPSPHSSPAASNYSLTSAPLSPYPHYPLSPLVLGSQAAHYRTILNSPVMQKTPTAVGSLTSFFDPTSLHNNFFFHESHMPKTEPSLLSPDIKP